MIATTCDYPTVSRSSTKASPTRHAFSVSREAEYFSELTKQIGYPPRLFLLATVKELLDNAIDHLEEIRRPPDIEIEFTTESVVVTDNGEGISADIVRRMLDFSTTTSSRALYRSPTRGAMGNAGKCALAIPFVLSPSPKCGRVTITAQGIRHAINIKLDALKNCPVVEHVEEAAPREQGTRVELHLPTLPSILQDSPMQQFVSFCRHMSCLNPHLSLVLKSADGTQKRWSRSTVSWRKWTAAEPEPPGWHDIDSFERLAGAVIAQDQAAGRDRHVREFIKDFAGMKRSATLKMVLQQTALSHTRMSSLVNEGCFNRSVTGSLLTAMQGSGKSPKPEMLGSIGRQRIADILSEFPLVGDLKYKRISGATEAGLPFVVEAGFAEYEDGGLDLITGCNFAASISSPIVRTLDGLLERQKVNDYSNATLVLHVAVVAPTFVDRGKSVLAPCRNLKKSIVAVVESVTAAYCKARTRAERGAASAAKRSRRSTADCSLKDAIIEVLPQAITKASGGGLCEFSDRDLYYATRELIQTHTQDSLTQKYFDKVVDDWEIDNGLVTGRLRDPRGFLLEPHTGRRIPLGTESVDNYEIPPHLYGTIIYCEKKGLLSKFQFGKIGERYDCAIMASEGYAVRAAKALIDAAQQGKQIKVLCFHDADPAGYNIARTLSLSTGAHRFRIEVIDAGLHLEEALAMGLSTETFVRKNSLPSGLNLTPVELDYFTGQAHSVTSKTGRPKTEYVDCRRVELNALSADPHAFVRWIEGKLAENGVAQKLVPPRDVLKAYAADQRDIVLQAHVKARLSEALGFDHRVDLLTRELAATIDLGAPFKRIGEWAAGQPAESWTSYVDREMLKAVADQDGLIRRRANELIA